MKKLLKKITTVILSAATAASVGIIPVSAAPAYAFSVTDDGAGSISVMLESYTFPEEAKVLSFAVWSAVNGQDDIHWYDAPYGAVSAAFDTAAHNDDTGTYYVHVYQRNKDNSMTFVYGNSISIPSVVRPVPVVSVSSAIAPDEKTAEISVSGYVMPAGGKEVTAAVWSEVKDQDDLKWYDLSQTGTDQYTYTCSLAAHHSAGKYNVHVYLRNKDNSMTFIGSTSFTETPVSFSGISVTDLDNDAGTCTVTLSDITAPSGITDVKVPIWSRPDQSDIRWYSAEKISEGTYRVKLDIANHKYNVGKYYIHAYAANGSAAQDYLGSASVTFTLPATTVTAAPAGDGYLLKTLGISVPGGVKGVRYAVWSEKNDQDDLKWLDGTLNAAKNAASYSLSLSDFHDTGKYYVHCYAAASDNSMVFLGNTSFIVEEPTFSSLDITTDNKAGTFTVSLKGLTSGLGVSKVQFPIWSRPDQSDIVWYLAEKNSSGDYVVSSSVASHRGNTGTYHVHVYMTNNSGMTLYLTSGTMDFTEKKGTLSVTDDPKQTEYPVKLTGAELPGGIKEVKFAVWSEKNSQDDIVWYQGTASGTAYKATVKIANHKTEGKYYVHCYAYPNAGDPVFMGSKTFTVTPSANAAVSVSDVNEAGGSFKVNIQFSGASADIASVKVPVWCASDQSDIVWYQADKQSAGVFSVTVNIANHKDNLGKYKIHIYPTFVNGIQIYAGSGTYNFNPSNYLTIVNTGNGKRAIVLRNVSSSASKVQFPIWSDDGGQDDIVWYNASKQADGSWQASFSTANHLHSGKYHVHAYVNGSGVVGKTFNVAQSEMGKNGWVYENGYKLYYNNGTLLKDLRAVLGPQASYYVTVNRVTCTVNIFAQDGANGYIIPVITFTCSVGLPSPDLETPLGTFTLKEKYRWKELMGPSYGQYVSRVTYDGVYFHSVAGYNMTSYNLSAADYNALGSPASHGCIRLTVRDAKWLYENVPSGCLVYIFDGPSPGPYGKPATIKIPPGQNWDPTDPNL